MWVHRSAAVSFYTYFALHGLAQHIVSGEFRYWDWTLDSPPLGRFVDSPVWDPVYGFGGNGPFVPVPADNPFGVVPGRTGGGCVANGPFKNMTVNMGPNDSLAGNPRCLTRDFSPYFAERYLGVNQTRLTLAQPDFGSFNRVVEGGPDFEASGVHGGAHYGVGSNLGVMGDLYTSPGGNLLCIFLHALIWT